MLERFPVGTGRLEPERGVQGRGTRARALTRQSDCTLGSLAWCLSSLRLLHSFRAAYLADRCCCSISSCSPERRHLQVDGRNENGGRRSHSSLPICTPSFRALRSFSAACSSKWPVQPRELALLRVAGVTSRWPVVEKVPRRFPAPLLPRLRDEAHFAVPNECPRPCRSAYGAERAEAHLDEQLYLEQGNEHGRSRLCPP